MQPLKGTGVLEKSLKMPVFFIYRAGEVLYD